MKKILFFLKSIFLQSLLATVAFCSWYEVHEIGNQEFKDSGTYLKDLPNGDYEIVGTSVAVSTGYIGGSLALDCP